MNDPLMQEIIEFVKLKFEIEINKEIENECLKFLETIEQFNQTKINKSLAEIYEDLMQNQHPLGAEFEKILFDNLDDLM